MLKRLAYLTTASILLLLAVEMFCRSNHLNALTLTQQQTQRQITQWHDQPQPDRLPMSPALKPNNSTPTENNSRYWRNRSNLEHQLSTSAITNTATCSRVKAKYPVSSPLWAAKAPFSLISNKFHAGRQFTVIASSGYRSHSFSLLPRRQRTGLAATATGREPHHLPQEWAPADAERRRINSNAYHGSSFTRH